MNMKGKILKKNEWVQILYDRIWEENRLEGEWIIPFQIGVFKL